MNTTFWALVQNDLHAKRARHLRHPLRRLYFALAVLAGFGWYTYALMNGYINPLFFFLFTPALIFILFGLSFFHIRHEQRNRTAGWWLTLPYSRKFLLGAKITAIVLRFFRIILSILLFVVVLELEAAILRPEMWTAITIQNVIFGGLRMIGYMLLQIPIVTLSCVTLAVLQGSVWRAAAPLFWIGFIVLINLLSRTVFSPFQILEKFKPEDWAQYNISLPPLPFFTWHIAAAYLLIFVIVLPIVLFLFSTHILDRYTEVK